MDPGALWYGRGVVPRMARALLLPFSALYWLGWKAYRLLYRWGIKRSKRPHRPVVAIGNFTVGGSGKTPAVLAAARILREKGHRVALGCSGYGSPRQHGASLAPDGPLDPAEWGDEPALLRSKLPDAPILVGRDRVRAAQLAAERLGGSILLMDDGLQHLPLTTDVRIALDDPDAPNRWVLPAGPYREPADPGSVDLILPGRFRLERTWEGIFDSEGQPLAEPAWKGREVAALCAIARPRAFLESLDAAGLKVVVEVIRPDHDPLAAGTLFESVPAGMPIVATEKDWVKLRRRPDLAGKTIWIVRESARIEPAEEFADWLHGRTQEIAPP